MHVQVALGCCITVPLNPKLEEATKEERNGVLRERTRLPLRVVSFVTVVALTSFVSSRPLWRILKVLSTRESTWNVEVGGAPGRMSGTAHVFK